MKPFLQLLIFTLTLSLAQAQESRVLVQNSKGTTSDNSTLNANWSDAYDGRDMENTIADPERSTIVFLFYSITSQAGKSLDNVLSKAEDLAKKIDKAPTLQKYIEGLVKAKDIAKIDRLSKLIDDLGAENLEKVLAKADNSVDDLLGDLASSDDLVKAFKGSPDLVDAWKRLLHGDISDVIRKNPTYLSAVSKQISNYGDKILFKFERVLPHITPQQYDTFFKALDNPKSIDHVRSLVGDFENIPGI